MKISFVRLSDDKELCSCYLDTRFSGKRNATLLEALLVSAVVYSEKRDNYGYFLVPKSLMSTLCARYHKGNGFDKLFGYEVRWAEE